MTSHGQSSPQAFRLLNSSALQRSGSQWRSNGLCRLCNAQGPPAIKGPPAIRRALQSEGSPTSWAPINFRSLQQSEGPQQSEGHLAIRAPSNLRGSQQFEGPPIIWGALSTWGASSNLRPQQSEGPSATLRAPGNLMGPSNWGSDPLELLSFRSTFRPMLSTRSTIFELLNCSMTT